MLTYDLIFSGKLSFIEKRQQNLLITVPNFSDSYFLRNAPLKICFVTAALSANIITHYFEQLLVVF